MRLVFLVVPLPPPPPAKLVSFMQSVFLVLRKGRLQRLSSVCIHLDS